MQSQVGLITNPNYSTVLQARWKKTRQLWCAVATGLARRDQ